MTKFYLAIPLQFRDPQIITKTKNKQINTHNRDNTMRPQQIKYLKIQ